MYGRNANVQKGLILYTAVIVQLIERNQEKQVFLVFCKSARINLNMLFLGVMKVVQSFLSTGKTFCGRFYCFSVC